jgi:MFS transporter, SP family, general alpha glucoside:H+ symporter
VGSIIGLYLNGIISEAIGYKKTMFGSLVLMIAFIFIPFFAQNLPTLLAGGILQGMPWGVFQTLTTTYASEICPVALRAYLTTYVNLCWVFGQLIAAGVLRGFLSRTDQWAYRIPFAVQWIWPVPILIGTIFAPESPWWLTRKGRYEDAKRSLLALTSRNSNTPFDADEQVSMMKATTELEKAMSKSASYLQCFRGIDARRTEIASVAWIAQAFCGAAFMGYSTQFYERAGLTKENAFNMSLGQYAMGAIGTMGSWILMVYFGRRTLYIAGLGIMTAILLIIGFCGIAPASNISASWAIGSMLLIYTFVYDITVGPVCYSLVAEIPSTRLKIKTVVLARNFYNMGGLINNALMPQMIGVNAWNWGAKTGFFWAGLCGLLLAWSYFRLPEPKGRTYGELDVLFEHKVSARKFKTTQVDQFSGESVEIIQPGSDSDSQNEKARASELKV